MKSPRGSVLLLAVVLVVVLTLLAAVALKFSGTELGASRNFRTGDQLTSCAEAGRAHLLSQFRVFGAAPTQLQLATRIDRPGQVDCDDGDPPTNGSCVRTGHLGENTKVVGVRALTGFNPKRTSSQDLSNKVASPNQLGEGIPYQVIVHCQDSLGRESE
jgi:Tfp pilus assembly protein PilX